MSDLNLQPETNETVESVEPKKKCCGKLKNFFTKEAKEGQRVLNWKFWVLLLVVLAIIWVL